MRDEGATYGFLVPTQMRKLLQLPDDGELLLPTLRLLISSGAVLFAEERAEIMRRLTPHFDEPVFLDRGRQRRGATAGASGRKRARSVGKVFRACHGGDRGSEDRVLPNGEVGRIRQKSPDRAKWIPQQPGGDGENTSRTDGTIPGDLGRQDDDGFLYLAGRSKEMIIRGGVNIYPGEIEEPLLTLPQIHDCAAVAWASPMMGEEVALFVVPAARLPRPNPGRVPGRAVAVQGAEAGILH